MADDLIPTGEPGFLDKLNLPKLVAGSAGEAISRLVAGAVDIPAAWMNQFAQGIKDKTEAKSAVSKAVGDAAAQLAVSNPEIVKRAAYSLLSKQIRGQANREAIAKKTAEVLNDETDQPQPEQTQKVDDDWLNVFEKYAEDASSERLQILWARILAGQIRRPKAFSLQTLRFVSELDEKAATLFEKYVPRVVMGDFIPYPENSGVEFSELLRLEELGLLRLGAGLLHKTFSAVLRIAFDYKTHYLLLQFEKRNDFQIPAAIFSNVGKELYSIVQTSDDIARAKSLVEKFPKANLTAALYVPSRHREGEQAVVLWSKAPSQPDNKNNSTQSEPKPGDK
jgi:hypothetical protein